MPDLQAALALIIPETPLIAGKIDQTGHLAADILAGAPADVMISANIFYLELVRDSGLVQEIHRFARNSFCMLVRKKRAGSIRSIQDVRRSDVRTLVCPPKTDPCGQYTMEKLHVPSRW